MNERAYVVVPFERRGSTIGPTHVIYFGAVEHARRAVNQLAQRTAGVALLERSIDPETGEDRDVLIAGIGAVPAAFPDSRSWTLKLN